LKNLLQQAYEQMKIKAPTPEPILTPAPQNANILDALRLIKANIINLEAMQTLRNESKTEQCLTAKTYADILKIPITAAQLLKHQEQQRARAEKFQSIILLNIHEISEETRQWFQTQSNENIATNIE
jgi:hypothetical protein